MKAIALLPIMAVIFLSGCVGQQVAEIQPPTETIAEEIPQETAQPPPTVEQQSGFSGKVIAGKTTKYIRFNQADYDKALSEGKVIYLYFYATWCPICAAERPNIFAAFNEMNYPDAVGFEVHYNDNEVTPEDESLSRKFGISYQHTTIILDKNGNEVFRSLSPISKETIKEKIVSVL